MSDRVPNTTARSSDKDIRSELTVTDEEQSVPLIIVEGDDVHFPQAEPPTAQIAHAEDVLRRFTIREKIPRAPKISPFRFLITQVREEWRTRAPRETDSRGYPKIHLFTEEELREILEKDESTPPLLLTETPTTSAKSTTLQRSVRQPGISTGGAQGQVLRISGRLRGESASSSSIEDKSELEE